MNSKYRRAVFSAILAALLYSISTPASKILLREIPSTMMAAFLYLGAGLGMAAFGLVRKLSKHEHTEQRLTKKDLPYTIGMIVLDIAAPISLMVGLTMTTAANASLLNNFEIVATAVIAMLFFKEIIRKRLWIAIAFVTLASLLLSFEDIGSLSFSMGSLFVLLAAIFWGLENNCTRMLSHKDPLEIVVVKGIFSGLGSLFIALILGERVSNILYIALALLLGFVAYGLSIYYYLYAQRHLGAAKTSAFYAMAPFVGAALSITLLKERPTLIFIAAIALMMFGAYAAYRDNKA
ncbi:MAG: DMT family transporter [Clostridiales bacterium]|nr:DMT family transporter [Clostridiales bacterium]